MIWKRWFWAGGIVLHATAAILPAKSRPTPEETELRAVLRPLLEEEDDAAAVAPLSHWFDEKVGRREEAQAAADARRMLRRMHHDLLRDVTLAQESLATIIRQRERLQSDLSQDLISERRALEDYAELVDVPTREFLLPVTAALPPPPGYVEEKAGGESELAIDQENTFVAQSDTSVPAPADARELMERLAGEVYVLNALYAECVYEKDRSTKNRKRAEKRLAALLEERRKS